MEADYSIGRKACQMSFQRASEGGVEILSIFGRIRPANRRAISGVTLISATLISVTLISAPYPGAGSLLHPILIVCDYTGGCAMIAPLMSDGRCALLQEARRRHPVGWSDTLCHLN